MNRSSNHLCIVILVCLPVIAYGGFDRAWLPDKETVLNARERPVADAENLDKSGAGSSQQMNRRDNSEVFSFLQKTETPYEILLRTRRERGVKEMQEAFSVGPVVAKARLRSMPNKGVYPIGYLGLQRQETKLVRPAGLQEVPADAPKEPVYFVVRVGEKDIPGITYRSTDRRKSVKLFLDTDGDGLLSDENEYVGTWLSMFRLTRTYQFGPVSMRNGDNENKGGEFHAQCSSGLWLVFYPALYREGSVVLDGRAYKIAIVDCDFDGKYNKLFEPPAKSSREPRCDVFAIDLDDNSKFDYRRVGESELMPLSRLVKVKNNYYRIDVAEDGSTVEFRQAKPRFGVLDLGGEDVKLTLWSDTAHQQLSGSGGKWRVPVGRYGVVLLELTETDSAGNKWTFKIDKAGKGKLGDFEIRPGESTSFRIGPPFQARTSIEKRGRDALVSFNLKGQAEELYVPGGTRNGKEVPEPEFKIIDGSGRVAHSGRFKFQ
ncbi:MAG: hypothetical protein HQ580_20065 [Planctomycetes bacterium]|nr:hypothetical protein [Planctomycetota bacterium]